MTLDMCGLSYLETFQQIKNAVEDFRGNRGNVVIFFNSNEQGKCRITQGFVEKVLECKTRLVEVFGFNVIEGMHETAEMAN